MFKLSESVNGKESIPAIHSGPKAPVTWPHPIEPRRGRVARQAKIEWQEASTPFCKSLKIHENEVACGHAKLSANQKHHFEFVNSEAGMPKNEGAKRAQGAPRVLTEVNYY